MKRPAILAADMHQGRHHPVLLGVASGLQNRRLESSEMAEKPTFKVGDHVSWNSEAGRVSGHIIKVHMQDFDYKGYAHHASADRPQYEIRSDKTDHVAAHYGDALSLIEG